MAIKNLLWRKTARLHTSEFEVITAALPRDDPRTIALLRQARYARRVERRRLDDSSFIVSIPYVKDSGDLIECNGDVDSPALVVRDVDSGREIAFTLRITRGGFLGPLTGRMLDAGPFLRNWKVRDMSPLKENWLPAALTPAQKESQRTRLIEWLNAHVSAEVFELIAVRQPATEAEIAAAERRLNASLPSGYVELLRISNGLRIGELTLHGTHDLVLTDFDGENIIVIAYLSPDAVLFVQADRSVSSIVLVSPESPDGHEYAGEAKSLVRKLLAEAAVTTEGG